MQENTGDVVFGSSVLGGFNRKNVLEYIDRLQNLLADNGIALDSEQPSLLLQSRAETKRAEERAERLADELEESRAQYAALQRTLEQTRAALAQAQADLRKAANVPGGFRRGKK